MNQQLSVMMMKTTLFLGKECNIISIRVVRKDKERSVGSAPFLFFFVIIAG